MALYNPYKKYEQGMDDAYMGKEPQDNSAQYMEGYDRAMYLLVEEDDDDEDEDEEECPEIEQQFTEDGGIIDPDYPDVVHYPATGKK